MNNSPTIICRCCDISQTQILEAVLQGYYTVADVMNFVGAGKGLCQGKICRKIIADELTRLLSNEITDITIPVPESLPNQINIRSVADLEGDSGI